MKRKPMARALMLAVGITSLVVCLVSALAVFSGSLDSGTFKSVFLVSSVVWFAVAGVLSAR